MWKGELAYAGESWKIDDLERWRSRTSTSSRWCARTSGDQIGIGVLEQIAFGPHARYGFKELLDPA